MKADLDARKQAIAGLTGVTVDRIRINENETGNICFTELSLAEGAPPMAPYYVMTDGEIKADAARHRAIQAELRRGSVNIGGVKYTVYGPKRG